MEMSADTQQSWYKTFDIVPASSEVGLLVSHCVTLLVINNV